MTEKRVQHSIVFNPEYDMDKEPYKYVKTLPDFALVKELIVDFFRENNHPSSRLRLMQLERRLADSSFCIASIRSMKHEIKNLREEIGIESKVEARIRELQERLDSREWSANSRWRIENQIKKLKIESKMGVKNEKD